MGACTQASAPRRLAPGNRPRLAIATARRARRLWPPRVDCTSIHLAALIALQRQRPAAAGWRTAWGERLVTRGAALAGRLAPALAAARHLPAVKTGKVGLPITHQPYQGGADVLPAASLRRRMQLGSGRHRQARPFSGCSSSSRSGSRAGSSGRGSSSSRPRGEARSRPQQASQRQPCSAAVVAALNLEPEERPRQTWDAGRGPVQVSSEPAEGAAFGAAAARRAAPRVQRPRSAQRPKPAAAPQPQRPSLWQQRPSARSDQRRARRCVLGTRPLNSLSPTRAAPRSRSRSRCRWSGSGSATSGSSSSRRSRSLCA